MQLRQRTMIRVPNRYTESKIPPPPGVATFVHPTIPYNPNLPPAAFPTIDFPPAISPDSAPMDEMDTPVPRKAIVFYDKRISPEVSPFIEQVGFEASAPSLAVQDTSQRTSERIQNLGGCSCGSYEHLSVDEVEEKGLGQSLEDFEVATEWMNISDGLKLMIVSELSKDGRSFDQVVELLALSDEAVNGFVEIHNKEILRRDREEVRIAKSQALQLRILLDSTYELGKSVFTDSLERYLYTNLEEPPASIIRKDDTERASSLLKTLRINHLAERLWSLEGAALSDNILYGPVPERREELVAPSALESVTEDEDEDTDDESWIQRKKRSNRRRIKRVLGKFQPKKTSADASMVVKMRLPSGLRTSVSGENLDETRALKPAALQSPMGSQRQRTTPTNKRVRSNIKSVKISRRNSRDRAAVPTPTAAEDDNITAALKTENELESASRKTLPLIEPGTQTVAELISTINAQSASSREVMLRHIEKDLAAKISERVEKLPKSSFQTSKKNQEDDPSSGLHDESLPQNAVDEVIFTAKHAPTNRTLRTRKATNVLVERMIKVPTFESKEVTPKAPKVLAEGYQKLEVVAPTKKTAADVQQKDTIIVVQNLVRPKRKQPYDSDDDPDR